MFLIYVVDFVYVKSKNILRLIWMFIILLYYYYYYIILYMKKCQPFKMTWFLLSIWITTVWKNRYKHHCCSTIMIFIFLLEEIIKTSILYHLIKQYYYFFFFLLYTPWRHFTASTKSFQRFVSSASSIGTVSSISVY